ncbi:MAG: O-acetylhomoserine aminocarboxypropyltransferase/cysteine synthase family protein [Thermodesulfobacteriota bacterium]|nr:O-acetylhomoserine aminocarboxypropyltransferase/cysteine synthase family protein [Thermodesulfobacteriota bacterium]
MENNWKIETQAVQGSYVPQPTEPRIPAICQSTTFKYSSADHVAKLFDLDLADHMYSRISNPTTAALEGKIALLEGGVAALATSSGQAAVSGAILNICQAGQHIVAASTLYGGTYSLFANTFPKMGIEVTFVDPEADIDEFKKAFRSETRCLYAETIGNPGLNVLDFAKFSALASEMDVPLIIDNTFATPYLCKPLELGANIVVHSTTKYFDGHATSLGGVIVDGGNFNWNNGKFPEMTDSDPSYHGLKYTEKFGSMAYIVKARVQYMRDLGCCPAPQNSFLIDQGLTTLPLRMERHSSNAQTLAEFLEQQPAVVKVNYPGLKSHLSYSHACKYLPKGCSGVITFEIKGGQEAGKKFMEACQLIALVIHVCDARSGVLHPASTTHRQLSAEQQRSAGVDPGMIRLSIGIEHIDDLITDVDQALAASQK